jgi:hypothetical protein
MFFAGLFIGLFVLGWWLMPVEWVGSTIADLSIETQATIVYQASDLYAFNRNPEIAKQIFTGWNGLDLACQLNAMTTDPAEKARLVSVVYAVNGVGCNTVIGGAENE